jgi:hypothetical protein
MGMSSLLLKGLYYLAFKLILSWLGSDEDSAKVEEALVNAKNEEEVKLIARRVLIETIDEHFLKETDIPDLVVDGLIRAENTEEIIAVLESETGQKTFFDGLGDLLGGILGLIFGKKT